MAYTKDFSKNVWEVFKRPVKKLYIGRTIHGTPYFLPWNFNPSILTIRKSRPKFLRCKYFKLWGREISYGWPIYITWNQLGWKDKWDSPRFEWAPAFQIFFFKWQFCIYWVAPDGNSDRYYEMLLWYDKYCQGDLMKAKNTWGWRDMDGNSTWNDNYLA